MTVFLKFLHVATIAVWAGGLIALPFLFRQRHCCNSQLELETLHRVTRFVYVWTASPAAFLAIATGTALIFLRHTFQEWFSLKMLLVGVLAMLHVVAGLVSAHIFEPRGRFGYLSYIALTSTYIVLVIAIIVVVLTKPIFDSNAFATNLFAPGALHQFFGETRTPIP